MANMLSLNQALEQQQPDDEYEEDGLSCHTAPGVVFTSMDDLKEHYRSDWHRYNLKRKVAGLPVVGKELFERVMVQAGAAAQKLKQTGTGHLKRPAELPRSVARAKRINEWADNHKDEIEAAEARHYASKLVDVAEGNEDDDKLNEEGEDDDDDEDGSEGWESMDEDEAEQVLVRMERMAKEKRGSGAGEESDGDYDSDDDVDGMELDLTNAPVRLAENGYELIITRDDGTMKRIGPRELRRYYKQRPRPEDQRQIVLAAKSENKDRGLAQVGNERGLSNWSSANLNGGFRPPMAIQIMIKKAQKALRRYQGGLMVRGGAGNKKNDVYGGNVKTKLPKSCPY